MTMATFIPRTLLTVDVDCMAGEERLIYETVCYKLGDYHNEGLKPIYISLIKETGNIILGAFVSDPMKINEFIIDVIRSTEGVIETTTYVRRGLIALVEDPAHLIEAGFSPENERLNASVMIDVIPGWEREVERSLCDLPLTESVSPVLLAYCFHSGDVDMILDISGTTADEILEYVIEHVRPIEGIIDTDTEVLSETTIFTSASVITPTEDGVDDYGAEVDDPSFTDEADTSSEPVAEPAPPTEAPPESGEPVAEPAPPTEAPIKPAEPVAEQAPPTEASQVTPTHSPELESVESVSSSEEE